MEKGRTNALPFVCVEFFYLKKYLFFYAKLTKVNSVASLASSLTIRLNSSGFLGDLDVCGFLIF